MDAIREFEAAQIARMDNDTLMREYLQTMRDCFGGNVFCGNARRWLGFLVDALTSRGITEIPNIFGPIQIRKWEVR